MVVLAIGTFFLGHLGVFDRGKEQMELQRMGTLVMEGVVRAIREGSRAIGNTQVPSGRYRDIQIFYPGEPFFDTNHNGVCDTNEDFIDIYQTDSDGSTAGFQNVWNSASAAGLNEMPTAYFEFDESVPGRGTIRKGTDEIDSVPWDILLNDATKGSIWFDNLGFDIPSAARSVGIAFTIRNDMGTTDPGDDISMNFSSSVNLRE